MDNPERLRSKCCGAEVEEVNVICCSSCKFPCEAEKQNVTNSPDSSLPESEKELDLRDEFHRIFEQTGSLDMVWDWIQRNFVEKRKLEEIIENYIVKSHEKAITEKGKRLFFKKYNIAKNIFSELLSNSVTKKK